MDLCKQYEKYFQNGPEQHGKLYILPGLNESKPCFRVYVFTDKVLEVDDEGEPKSSNIAMVYGPIYNNGTTELTSCGMWRHEGPWQDDFYQLISQRMEDISEASKADALKILAKERSVLSGY